MRPFIRWATKRARHGAALREGAKSALVARLEPLRTIFMEVGRRMHALGFLDAADDIFFLTWPEIDAFMRSWWDGRGARTLVKDRKAQRDVWLLEVELPRFRGQSEVRRPYPTSSKSPEPLLSYSSGLNWPRDECRLLRL